MKKVLILANSDMGLYRFRKEVLTRLNTEYEVHISVPNGDYSKEIKEIGCQMHIFDFERHGKNPFKELGLLNYYKNLVKSIGPDMVFTYTIKPNIYGGLACQLLNVPYTPNITGLGKAVEKKGLFSKGLLLLYKIAFRKANTVFFQNMHNMQFFQKKGIVKTRSILLPGSGVNLKLNRLEEYPTNDNIVLLFVGRVMKEKGVEELINAAQILKSEYDNLSFQMVGPIEEDYLKVFRKTQVEKYVEFLGLQKDVHKYMTNAHAVIVPSYHEGMSNVCLEAASCGRPILASKIPGCRETFDEGISGIGFEAKSVEDLVRAVKEFLALTNEQRAQMGLAGRKKMEKEFDREIIIKKYIEVLKEL